MKHLFALIYLLVCLSACSSDPIIEEEPVTPPIEEEIPPVEEEEEEEEEDELFVGTSFYLSSSGNDENKGTEDAPWKSLEKISSQTLTPGDTVLFKRGERFDGHFVVNGSGTKSQPILITSYGKGSTKPIITGEVGAAGGGDYREAILVENCDNLIFDGIEVQNERLVSRQWISDELAHGIMVENSGTEVMSNLVFRNMTFKNVFAVQPILDEDQFDKIQVAGLRFRSSKNREVGNEKHIRNILVEDCFFGNLQRFGIMFQHQGGLDGVGDDMINRNMDITIRNNEFSYNGGTGVLPNGTYNCLIENNIFDHPGADTDPRMPARGSSIWNINSINTIMQYNMCLSTRGYLDSYGIHIDNNNVNTFVQYNYMDDCEGGFVEILMDNKNAVYRFNVSVNSGFRKNETWEDSNFTIWVNSARWSHTDGNMRLSDGCYIYNNTVVINKPFTTSLKMDGKNMFVYNNIFSSTNGSGMGHQNPIIRSNGTPFTMRNNLFEGTVDPTVVSWDTHPVKGSAMFSGTGNGKNDFQLLPGSPAINSGVAITGPIVVGAGTGVFKDVPAYPNVDFYGNPVDLSSGTPNIGACNAKNVKARSANSSINSNEKIEWHVYPQPKQSTINISSNKSLAGTVKVSLVDLKGEVIQTGEELINLSKKGLDWKLDRTIQNGIYTLNIESNGVSHSRRIVWH